MRLSVVAPRYGTEVIGGSESAARMLAENLVARSDWTVDVFTTCGIDLSWTDHYAPGTVEVNGVTVHRFSSRGRSEDFATFPDNPVRWPLEQATRETCLNWCEKQGPVCPEVIDAVERADADVVAFHPYLYYPTVVGLPRLGARSVLHPAAHDEREIRLPIFREVFDAAGGLVFYTHGERRFVLDLFPLAERPQIVLGLGIDARPPDEMAARADLGFAPAERPYLCCVGRVDNAKGTGTLSEMFLSYKEAHPGPLSLVFVGGIVDAPPSHPSIVTTGPVSEGSKWAIIAGSRALVQPSPHESFSLVMMEAWHAGVPVVVNGDCEATREHCERSGGGLWFGGPASTDSGADFARAIERIERGEAEGLVNAGRAYTEAHFTWPVITDRYQRFLESVAERSSNR